MSLSFQQQVDELNNDWKTNPRWKGVKRDYSAEDVVRLRGSVQIEHTLARRGAEKLWKLVNEEDFVPTLGALTGGQAVQQVKAGLKAIYLSGWQVAAEAMESGNAERGIAVFGSTKTACVHSNHTPLKKWKVVFA